VAEAGVYVSHSHANLGAAPIKPESGVHVTEMIIYDLLLVNFPLATMPAIIIAASSANSSSTSL